MVLPDGSLVRGGGCDSQAHSVQYGNNVRVGSAILNDVSGKRTGDRTGVLHEHHLLLQAAQLPCAGDIEPRERQGSQSAEDQEPQKDRRGTVLLHVGAPLYRLTVAIVHRVFRGGGGHCWRDSMTILFLLAPKRAPLHFP